MKYSLALKAGLATLGVIMTPVTAGFAQQNIGHQQQLMGGESMESNKNACGVEKCGLPADDAELRKLLSPEQYRIVKENGTERPFANAYWDNHEPGLYVDVVSGEPLFSSSDKFDSGTGWPSFTKPISKDVVKELKDTTYGMTRIEVRSSKADSHLGHVFNDGPAPTRLRYCINSGSLKFIPLQDLEKAGFGHYREMVEATK